MMTKLDIRIRYRFDTGLSPTYGKDENHMYNYKEGLTNEYAEWLELRLGPQIRLAYQKNVGATPVVLNKHGYVKYLRDYKIWLEERVLKLFEFQPDKPMWK